MTTPVPTTEAPAAQDVAAKAATPPAAKTAPAAATGQQPPRERRQPRSSSLLKYKRVEKPRDEAPADEIRVMGSGRVPKYVAYASKLFTEQNKTGVTIRATGKAVAIAVSVCEVVKRRFLGLHQETTIGWTEITDEYEPLQAGLEPRIETRSVPCISVLLTKDISKVNQKAPGYQEPLDPSQIVEDPDAFTNVGQRMTRRPANRQRRNNKPIAPGSQKEGEQAHPNETRTDGPKKNTRRRRSNKRVGAAKKDTPVVVETAAAAAAANPKP